LRIGWNDWNRGISLSIRFRTATRPNYHSRHGEAPALDEIFCQKLAQAAAFVIVSTADAGPVDATVADRFRIRPVNLNFEATDV